MRDMRIDFDFTNEFENPQALKNHIQEKKSKLLQRLKDLIKIHQTSQDICSFFQNLKQDVEDKYKLIKHSKEHKNIATFYLYIEHMIELQLKVIVLDELNKQLFNIQKQNNNENVELKTNLLEIIDQKKKYEDGKQERPDFTEFLNVYEKYILLKIQAEEIVSQYRNNTFVEDLTKIKNKFSSKISPGIFNANLQKEREAFKEGLEKCKKEIDLFNQNQSGGQKQSDQKGQGGNKQGMNIEMQNF